jgi:hypothetical protein
MTDEQGQEVDVDVVDEVARGLSIRLTSVRASS